MSIDPNDFLVVKESPAVGGIVISVNTLAASVAETNRYISNVYKLFDEQKFDMFKVLGQRNISGVIGEIFCRYFCRHFNAFRSNPHSDGRPDLLFVGDRQAQEYYDQCFTSQNGRKMPIKSRLSPYPFGGAEVKATIGAQKTGYKRDLKQNTGQDYFEMGMPRIAYLNGLSYWAHHRHCEKFIGLYYDYYERQKRQPQILAVFYAELVSDDWNAVSLGSSEGKKTSNTSITAAGLVKVYDGCLLAIKDELYLDRFRKFGVRL